MADNYVLGRGKVYFDPFATDTTDTTGEDYLGNTPEFTLTIESEKLDHYNSDAGVKVKDESVVLQINRTGSFTTDNINVDNIARFFAGTESTITDAGLSGQSQSITGAIAGRYYQIGTAVNVAGLRDVTITSVMAGASTLTAGVGYTLEAELGRISFAADHASVLVSYGTTANTRSQIVTGANATIEGALRFVSYNAQGEKRDFYFPSVRLSPNGDFALKGDEWQKLGFKVEILDKSDTIKAIYIDGRPT